MRGGLILPLIRGDIMFELFIMISPILLYILINIKIVNKKN